MSISSESTEPLSQFQKYLKPQHSRPAKARRSSGQG